jgi:hypothetical protein
MPDNHKAVTSPKRTYQAIYQDCMVDSEFAECVAELETALDAQIWLLIQNGSGRMDEITAFAYEVFRASKSKITAGKRVGLLVHSPGGSAPFAYKIARLFQRRTEDFFTIVPLYAKSAATLLALSGREIIMGRDSEIGPLDVQLYDPNREDWDSALNAVQSIERLNAYALSALDQAMLLFLSRMSKRTDVLLPTALNYALGIVQPLLNKIDTVELTRKSRDLKVAEDYAIRLMKPNYPPEIYLRISSALVEKYSTHDFVIDRDEAGGQGDIDDRPPLLGLNIEAPSDAVEMLFDRLTPCLERGTIIGRIEEITP